MKKVGLVAVIILALAGALLFMRNMGMGGNDRGPGGGMMNRSVEDMKNKLYSDGEKPLPIPPILKDENPDPGKAEFSLVAQKGSMEFLKGKKQIHLDITAITSDRLFASKKVRKCR